MQEHKRYVHILIKLLYTACFTHFILQFQVEKFLMLKHTVYVGNFITEQAG
jgi:hypothetical protein